jgi:hypothetical protein
MTRHPQGPAAARAPLDFCFVPIAASERDGQDRHYFRAAYADGQQGVEKCFGQLGHEFDAIEMDW